MNGKFYTVLSTAPTLESINEAVNDFYCGSIKTLRRYDDTIMWNVLNADGSILSGVHVRTKRGRYLFVSVP